MIRNLFTFLRFAISKNLWRIILSTILDAFAILFAAGLYGLAAFLISLSALRPVFEAIMVPVVGVRFFGLGRAALRYVERIVSHDTTFRVLRDVRVFIYDKIEPVLPDFSKDTRRGNIISQMISDVETLQDALLRVANPLVVSLEVFLLGICISYAFHPVLAYVFILTFVPLSFIFPALLAYWVRGVSQKAAGLKLRLYNEFIEFSSGIKEIITNSREVDWKNKLDQTLKANYQVEKARHTHFSAASAISVFFQSFSLLVFLAISAWLGAKGEMEGIVVAAATLTITAFFDATVPLFSSFTRLEKVSEASRGVFSKPEGMESKAAKSINKMSEIEYCVHDSLLLKDISFSHNHGRKLIQNFSMVLEKGQIKAIVGKSGAGKSTLLNLILGFIKEASGSIFLNEKDMTNFTSSQRFGLFSVVEQNPYFFVTSIRDNMKIANPKASDNDIYTALEKACIMDLIVQLPQGLDTTIAEFGASLSAGELQRMAIARALLKDAPFFLLDEPTAGLDTITEKKIMELLLELKKNKGILVVTHRLVMLEQMDEVIHL